jgi:hypothetical protein
MHYKGTGTPFWPDQHHMTHPLLSPPHLASTWSSIAIEYEAAYCGVAARRSLVTENLEDVTCSRCQGHLADMVGIKLGQAPSEDGSWRRN